MVRPLYQQTGVGQSMSRQTNLRWVAALSIAVLLAGCFKDETVKPVNVSQLSGGAQPVTGGSDPATPPPTGSAGGSDPATPPPPPPPPPPPANGKPSISGTPVTSIRQGEAYSFKPLATDPDGDTLTFKIANKPAWASFDSKNGRLYGTPGGGDVGSYSNIRISVTDGTDTAQLSAFTLNVEAIQNGSATLSWTPPTENTDGSALTNLAGYKIYYGRSKDSLSEVVEIKQPGLTTYVLEDLSPATWFFTMTSYNSDGVESSRSEVVSKTVG